MCWRVQWHFVDMLRVLVLIVQLQLCKQFCKVSCRNIILPMISFLIHISSSSSSSCSIFFRFWDSNPWSLTIFGKRTFTSFPLDDGCRCLLLEYVFRFSVSGSRCDECCARVAARSSLTSINLLLVSVESLSTTKVSSCRLRHRGCKGLFVNWRLLKDLDLCRKRFRIFCRSFISLLKRSMNESSKGKYVSVILLR